MPKFGPALEVTERAPGPQIRVLNHIFRVVHRAEHAVAVHQQLPAVRRGQDRELLAIDRHGHALFQTGLPGGSDVAWRWIFGISRITTANTVPGLSTAMLKAAWSADGGRSESGPCRWFVGIQIGGLCRAAYTNRRRQPCARSSRLSRSRPMGSMQGRGDTRTGWTAGRTTTVRG